MARIPEGARLIANPVSKAPGFQMDNVFVMAGVPTIMRGMLNDVGYRLEGGRVVGTVSVRCPGVKEGDLAHDLAALEEESPGVSFGSYPWGAGGADYGVELVARSADPAALARAESDLQALAAKYR
jgi:molybdopterin-biosynthesis enzyme MoeA-like protein